MKKIELEANKDYEVWVYDGEFTWQRIEGSQKSLEFWDMGKTGKAISFIAK